MPKNNMPSLMMGAAMITALDNIKPSKKFQRMGKKRPRKLWTHKMEREYESRWQKEYIDRIIRDEWSKKIDWDKIEPISRK